MVSLAKPTVFILPVLLLILALVASEVQPVSSQEQTWFVVSGTYTAPDYLGQSMSITVWVTDTASIPMQIQSLTVALDWNQNLAGDTPRIVQPGQQSTWQFDNVQIPSYTWTGKHTYDVAVMVGFADSNGGWSRTLTAPFHDVVDFGVQEQPPSQPPPAQGAATEWCLESGVTTVCATMNGPQGPVTEVGPEIPTGGNGGDFWGSGGGALMAVVVLLVAVIIGVGIVGSRRKKTASAVAK